ncbi:MAG: penicillin-binding transpeptidase domain-containing protein [Gemmatimonadota bacterium]
MARPAARITLLEVCFLLAIVAVVGRAADLQIIHGQHWTSEAERQRKAEVILPARRGSIFDRNGSALSITQEYYHVGIAPNEVSNRAALIRAMTTGLELPRARVDRDLASGKRWLYYYGPFTALQIEALRPLSGVHLDSQFARTYPAGALARPVIGALTSDSGTGASGIELALDSMLRGVPGVAYQLRDRAGHRFDSPSRRAREPLPGVDVTLTLDAELQDIAERGLEDALAAMHAIGGDVVFLDPRTGEILALASLQESPSGPTGLRAAGFTDPFEPGSTAKLFTAAALLSHGRVDSTDREFAENGQWIVPGRPRPITDAHKSIGSLTLAQAIQVSSNIVMAKFSRRLTSAEQYDKLRDFGFGSPTGVEFPSESRGRLNRPDRWNAGISGQSIAMGYEFGVTPIQLATAYGAIANDGILLAPTLVKAIRGRDGTALYEHRPEPVRRAVTPEIAARLREFLRGAVGEGGTGERAQLANFTLMGKTGTAERFENGRYVPGKYTGSFAALFPADDPQLVVIVKIDDPKGQYYGGSTAAPVTRSMLQQALSARRVALDRSRLATSGAADTNPAAAEAVPSAERRVVIPWPGPVPPDSETGARLVPNVVGTTSRRAALALHRRGFHVSVRGLGTVTRTEPAPGDSARYGETVIVWAE